MGRLLPAVAKPIRHPTNTSAIVAAKPSQRTGPAAKTTVALKNMKAKNA